ncbi:MAG TPA: hypothetical protein VNW53_10380 [Phenylobacterium sp.]|jgi:hypothetical protein|uniref:hypothetical protein n=1 Tax=Phenylobacterium sp. TaxID=1871053 RepID=UPI002B8225F4|nr:hypothetical protein [Phenylobacterium sp.]HXA39399.1 hypothetical protein [Phenylobacterium sp.]
MTPTPRAVRHFGLAAMEARAAQTRAAPARPTAAPATPPRRIVVRLWLPMTAISLLLAPFAILLSPLIWFAPPPYGYRPFATVMGIGALLLSLGGTVVEVDTHDALIRIRIF